MIRIEDLNAAAPVDEAEIARILGAVDETADMQRPVSVWEIDPQSGRPVCRWVMETRGSRK